MNDELLLASHEEGSKAHDMVSEISKGIEVPISREHAWLDKEGHVRTENRTKWWCDARSSYGEILFDCPDGLKDAPVDPELKIGNYPTDALPVFLGHYWLNDHMPELQSSNVVCLDYSIAKGGALVAYRWNGEDRLSNENFVFVR